ncbi:MAG: hypothetical protein JNN05_00990, partial [Candidatus Omnitrophica bacterium]|nr:hypothetical protein [Candidatus Omnitrophota bacterium]
MSAVLSKIFKIVLKVFLWVLVIYLVLGFLVIPLVLTWAVRSQGIKYTGHAVHVKSIRFNPLSFRLSVNGLEMIDRNNKEVMIGVNRFLLDFSFLSLFK